MLRAIALLSLVVSCGSAPQQAASQGVPRATHNPRPPENLAETADALRTMCGTYRAQRAEGARSDVLADVMYPELRFEGAFVSSGDKRLAWVGIDSRIYINAGIETLEFDVLDKGAVLRFALGYVANLYYYQRTASGVSCEWRPTHQELEKLGRFRCFAGAQNRWLGTKHNASNIGPKYDEFSSCCVEGSEKSCHQSRALKQVACMLGHQPACDAEGS